MLNSDNDSLIWTDMERSIVLLKNEADILPIRYSEKQHLTCMAFGFGEENVFSQTFQKYFSESPRRKYFDKNDCIIAALNADEFSPVSPDYQAFAKYLEFVAEKGSLVLVIFGNPDIIALMPVAQKAKALIVVPENTDIAQSLAVQLIFGGIGAAGKLAEPISGLYYKGVGLTTAGGLRLRYSPPVLAGMDAQLLADSITAIVEQGIREHAYPGAQVLVAKDGHVVFHRAYGFHTYDSLQAVQTDDIYDFASVTKVTTTLPILMKLYGEGKFDLDAPLKTYFPFFKKSDKGDVTYRELLAHFGRLKPGIVFWREAKDKDGDWKCRTFKDHYSRRFPIVITDSLFLFKKYKKQIYKGIRDLPLNEKRSYVYSDLSFILYPAVVEKLTKEDLEPYLKSTFYRSIGATTLTFKPLRYFPKERIVPTERDTFFRKKQILGTVHDENAAMLSGVSGHAGLFGSANDLAKLVQLYLNGGVYGGQRFISEAAVKEFTRCQFCEEGNRRGLGFDKPLIEFNEKDSYVAKSASPESFGHSGYTGTFFWADPKNNLIVIFFSNRVFPDRSSVGLYDLNIRPRLQQAVYDAIKN